MPLSSSRTRSIALQAPATAATHLCLNLLLLPTCSLMGWGYIAVGGCQSLYNRTIYVKQYYMRAFRIQWNDIMHSVDRVIMYMMVADRQNPACRLRVSKRE